MMTKIITCGTAAKELVLSGLWGTLAWATPHLPVCIALAVIATLHLVVTVAKLAQRARPVTVGTTSSDYVHVGGGLTSSSAAAIG